jgi:AcrR family transcriptional regulator
MDADEVKAGETRRDRRIDRRRNEIMTAAAQVFAEKGYASTTTRDIANQADIGEGTLYNYFDSKRDILLGIVGQIGTAIDDAFLAAGKLENRQAMVALLERSLEIITDQPHYTQILLVQAWIDRDIFENYVLGRLVSITQMLEGLIANLITSGQYRPIDAALGARMTMGMFFGIILPFLRGVEPPLSPERRHTLAEAVISLLLDGIRLRDLEKI